MTFLSADELVSISVEPRTGFANGAPAYGSATVISGAIRRRDSVVRDSRGEEVRADLEVWVDSGETVLPSEGARLEVDGERYVVLVEDRVPELGTTGLSHVKLWAREE